MLGNFFRRSTDRKQRVNKERNVEIDCAASSGEPKEPSPSLRCRQHCRLQTLASLLKDLFIFFEKGVLKNKGVCHKCQIISQLPCIHEQSCSNLGWDATSPEICRDFPW